MFCKIFLILFLVCLVFVLIVSVKNFVGDFVYCDVNSDGIFGFGDFLLNGVVVRLQCMIVMGIVCVDMEIVFGMLYLLVMINLVFNVYFD